MLDHGRSFSTNADLLVLSSSYAGSLVGRRCFVRVWCRDYLGQLVAEHLLTKLQIQWCAMNTMRPLNSYS